MRFKIEQDVHVSLVVDAYDEHDALTQYWKLSEGITDSLNDMEEEHDCENEESEIYIKPIYKSEE